MPNDRILLTPKSLANRWSMKTSTLAQWRWNGFGPPYIKMGKGVRYNLKDIEQFEEERIRLNTSDTGIHLRIPPHEI